MARHPNLALSMVAVDYAEYIGNPHNIIDTWRSVDENFAWDTAYAYLSHLVTDNTGTSYVRGAYDALITEVHAQFRFLLAAGFEYIPVPDDPYISSKEMFDDAFHGSLKVYAGEASHPYMTDEQNVRFRWVHDLFGHAMHGNSFSQRGEYNAMLSHAQMFSPSARLALYSETHGQNSVYNLTGSFAPQKADILPAYIRSRLEDTLHDIRKGN